MATVVDTIIKQYPLHWLVWNNSIDLLKQKLDNEQHDIELRDTRGRTPLMLAVTLGNIDSAKVLLESGADANCENKDGWSVVQEAVSTGDPDLLAIILERRDNQRHAIRSNGIPILLDKLKDAPDFYVEMKWEFTSWMPLISRMCPSDTYKVYKRGANVRIDTTLLGFEGNRWQRGNKSFIFKGSDGGATLLELDHENHQVWSETFENLARSLVTDPQNAKESGGSPDPASDNKMAIPPPSAEAITQRLTTPICTNYVDINKISFERNKSGIWGWRSDKAEEVNGHDCRVFSASNVELITKTRTEHLTEVDKARAKPSRMPLQSFFGIAETEDKALILEENGETNEMLVTGNPCNLSPEEYFSTEDLGNRDIGRPKELNTKIQKFRATLWLCTTYPLQLQEQIMPILDLMASMSSPHFARLKEFIQMQLPSGFPVKIEIPLLHVVNARITFGNIFGTDEAVPHVSTIDEGDRITCILDEEVFDVPSGYSDTGIDERRQYSFEDEDDLLQYAIQQSLIEAGSEKEEVDIWEALKAERPSRPSTPNLLSEEDRQLQRASPYPGDNSGRRASSPAFYSAQSTPVPSPTPYSQFKSFFTSNRNLPKASKDTLSPNMFTKLKAIQASLACFRDTPGAAAACSTVPVFANSDNSSPDDDLQAALVLSENERMQEEQERTREERELAEILKLSLIDK